MKYPMVRFKTTPILIFLFAILCLNQCALPEVINAVQEDGNMAQENALPVATGTEKPNPSLLRLTYDTAFRPPPGYILEEKGNLHEKGNVYKIRFPVELHGFLHLKISSTNTENTSRFVYEVSQKELEKAKWKKYYYLPVQNKPNSATITIFSCSGDLACARWEWYYNNFLIVFESRGRLSESDLNQKSFAENYHSLIEKHLLVY